MKFFFLGSQPALRLFQALLIMLQLRKPRLFFRKPPEHRLLGIPVLCHHAADKVQPLFGLLKFLFVKLHVFHIIRHGAPEIGKHVLRVGKLAHDIRKPVVIGGHRLHRPQRPPDLIAVHGLIGRLHGLHDFLPMDEPAVPGRQLLFFSGTDPGLLDLVDFKPQKIGLPPSLFPVHGKAFRLRLKLQIPLVRLCRLGLQAFRFLPGIFVENLQMLLAVEQGLVLMLSVDVKKQACHGFELQRSNRLVIDPAGAPGLGNLPGNDEKPVLVRIHVQGLQLFSLFLSVHGKDKLDIRIVFPGTDHIL